MTSSVNVDSLWQVYIMTNMLLIASGDDLGSRSMFLRSIKEFDGAIYFAI